jgi:UDP-glucose 4-epimerase
VFGDDYSTPDGSCIRDYIHVVDLGKAHVRAMQYLAERSEAKIYEPFNVGTGIGISVLELIEKFKSVTHVALPYVIGARRSGDVEKVFADPTKISATLKWKAEFPIEESLLHAWQWEKKIRNIA